MKKSLLLAAGIALFVGPALAQTQIAQKQQNGMKTQTQQQNPPRLFVGEGITDGNAVYDCTGKYMGSDPDPHIRAQLLKEGQNEACEK